ncbi:MAG: GGDEF domain-containing protein [Campylobacterota bacterium]
MWKYIKRKTVDYKAYIDSKNLELVAINRTLEDRVVQRTQELKEATDKLEEIERTDILTDIHNRYSIMKILDAEVDRAKRYNNPLTIFMYDVDNFKRVNDIHGLRVGDDTLYNLTKVVKDSLRDIDIVGRYGGKEFLVIMPSTLLSDAIDVAQRVCKSVSDHKFSQIEHLTISVGLVELQRDETMDMLFTRADRLLVKSKNGGRNRVSF